MPQSDTQLNVYSPIKQTKDRGNTSDAWQVATEA